MNHGIITDLSSFDPQKVGFIKLHKQIDYMDIYAIKYNGSDLFVELPQFKLTKYGIPQLGHFFTSPNEIRFIKVPIDPTQPNCNMIKELINKLENKIKGFNASLKNNYQFMPVIKNDGWYPKFKYHPTNNTFETPVYVVENGIPHLKNISNATDLNAYLTNQPDIRMIVAFRMWVAGNKTYGMTAKIMQMEITPGTQQISWVHKFSQYAFTKNIEKPNVDSSSKIIESYKAAFSIEDNFEDNLEDNIVDDLYLDQENSWNL